MSARTTTSSTPTDGTPLRRCSRGEWYAVFGDRATVILPPVARDRVATTWQLADEGADFDTLLDHVLSGGLRDLPGLAMLDERADGEVRVLLRGPVRAVAVGSSGEEQLSAQSGSFTDRVLEDVSSLSVELELAVGSAELVVSSGVARIGSVLIGGGPVGDGPVGEAPSVDASEPTTEQPVVGAEPDHDGSTVIGATPRQSVGPPGIPGQPPAPAVTSRPVAGLAFSTGERVEVDRVIIVGRAPEARRFASHEHPRLISVPSPQQEISSTHLEIRPGSGADHGAAVVTDMGSTNGTVLVQPGLPPEDLRAGVAVALIPGAILDLGDGVTIQTTNP